MKQIEKLSEGTSYTAVSIGKLAELNEHVLVLSPEIQIPGKVFLGNALGTTGAEISFQSFPVGGETGFVHTHNTHEEIYIFVQGKGEFQVDGPGRDAEPKGEVHRFGIRTDLNLNLSVERIVRLLSELDRTVSQIQLGGIAGIQGTEDVVFRMRVNHAGHLRDESC